MMKSPVYPKYENGDEFDPQVDFAQFLKEARTHKCQEKFEENLGTPDTSEEAGNGLCGRSKQKKTWKSSLFSWFKADKKSSKIIVTEEQKPPSNSSYNKSKPRLGYVSGPINGIKGSSTVRPRRPASGPLSGLFNPTKRAEDEAQIPYISLGLLNNPRSLQSYGPVYLVT